jgi:hypothetical protein
MYVYVISLLASVFIVALSLTSFKVGAVISNRWRHLLGDIEATLCTALGGVKVPLQHGTLDEEQSAALTLSRWQVRDLQHLHYEIQSYLGLRDIGPIRETEEADPHVPKPLAAPAAEFERLSGPARGSRSIEHEYHAANRA